MGNEKGLLDLINIIIDFRADLDFWALRIYFTRLDFSVFCAFFSFFNLSMLSEWFVKDKTRKGCFFLSQQLIVIMAPRRADA